MGTGEALCELAHAGRTSQFIVAPGIAAPASVLSPEPASHVPCLTPAKGEATWPLSDDSAWDGTGRPLSFGYK